MRKMKHIKPIIVAVLFLMVWLPAQAQWAGEDKKVYRMPNGDYPVITIGLPDNSNKHYYTWRGDYIISQDVHQPQIEVQPHDSVTTYHVERLTECGMEEEEVVVRLMDSITIKSVTPKICCYNYGEAVKLEDFEIVTDPPGYESLVEVEPRRLDGMNNCGWNHGECVQELTFKLTHHGMTSFKKVPLTIYNSNIGIAGIGLNKPFEDFQEKIKSTNTFFQGMKTAAQGLTKLFGFVPGAKCVPDVFFACQLPYPNEFIKACCKGKAVDDGVIIRLGQVTARLSMNCSFPVPNFSVSIPVIGDAGLFVDLELSIVGTAGPFEIKHIGDECTSWAFPLTITGNLGGGADLRAGDKKNFSAEIMLFGSASTTVSFTSNAPPIWKPLTLSAYVRCKVIGASITLVNATWKLGTVQLGNPVQLGK